MAKSFNAVLAFWAMVLVSTQGDAASFQVYTTNDSGVGSLRMAIELANSTPGEDRIWFNIAGTCNEVNDCRITPTTELPHLTDNETTIDGFSQTGASEATATTPAIPRIWLDGSSLTNTNGLVIESDDNIIKGLIVNNFDYNGIAVGSGAVGNRIMGNFIGTDVNGTSAQGNGLGGVFIAEGAQNNNIGDCLRSSTDDDYLYVNVLSGNLVGAGIHGSATNENCVGKNLIGTDKTGTASIGNSLHGIYVYGGAQSNALFQNIIGGNGVDGIRILGTGTYLNQVISNFIGVNVDFTNPQIHDLGNDGNGITVMNGAQESSMGGNVIAFNGGNGIELSGAAADNNIISENVIGVMINFAPDVFSAEDMLIGNDLDGISIHGGAADNKLGRCESGTCYGNLIGDNRNGVSISGVDTTENALYNNRIGIDSTGSFAQGNRAAGVVISDSANNNYIGGTIFESMRNTISGNIGDGIVIEDGDNNYIWSNNIGTDKDGLSIVANGGHGIMVTSGSSDNRIADGNVVCGSAGDGIRLTGGAYHTTITDNYIGTNSAGASLGNNGHGITVEGSAEAVTDNLIGSGNTIAYNAAGVVVNGAPAVRNRITENSIYNNTGKGIAIENGANGSIAPPLVSKDGITASSVSGTACPGCFVEVFASPSNDGEGKVFLASGLADGSGNFTIPVSMLPFRHITATSTGGTEGTSEFSAKLPFLYWPMFIPAMTATR